MQQAIMGKEKILMFRRLADTKIKNASKLALQVTHTLKYEREQDIQQTKDGGIVIGGGLECELELEAVSTRDELNEMLEKSVINDEKLECWEIDLKAEKDEQGRYKAKYMQGNLTDWELPSDVEEVTTLTTTFKIDDKPKDGYATLTEEQEQQITYAFRDTTPYKEEE